MQAVSRPALDERSSARRRVLVVDDLEDLAMTLALLIESLGHDAVSTTQPDEVLQLLADFQPDIVFLDISMPGLSGWDLARQIRSHPRGEKPYLIALTGLAEADDRRRSSESGFDEHWIKPLEIAQLMTTLANRRTHRGETRN